MKFWGIWEDNDGAYAPEQLMSLWSTKALAEEEVKRLHAARKFRHQETYYLGEVETDTSFDDGIPEGNLRYSPRSSR